MILIFEWQIGIHKNIMIQDSKFKRKAPHPLNYYNLNLLFNQTKVGIKIALNTIWNKI